MKINQVTDEDHVELKTGYTYIELLKFSGFDCTGLGCEFESCVLNVQYNHKYKRKRHPKLTLRQNKQGENILICRDFET